MKASSRAWESEQEMVTAFVAATGQHTPAIGTSTADITDIEDMQSRLADFNEAWQLLRYGVVAGVAW